MEFRRLLFRSRILVAMFEDAHGILDDLDVEGLADRYFDLLQKFTAKYSLRYDLRSPCVLCPTLPGVFSGLMRDLKESVSGDNHLAALLNDLEESFRDLRLDPSARSEERRVGKSVSVRVDLGGRRRIKKKKKQ